MREWTNSWLWLIFFLAGLGACRLPDPDGGQVREIPLAGSFEEAELVRFPPDGIAEQGVPDMAFEFQEQDFGSVQEGRSVDVFFPFENRGSGPLLIREVRSGCGCTATRWPERPIAAGEKDTLFVRFNSTGRLGEQQRVIHLTTNARPAPYRLLLKGQVLSTEPN
jgi:hypothetical protein